MFLLIGKTNTSKTCYVTVTSRLILRQSTLSSLDFLNSVNIKSILHLRIILMGECKHYRRKIDNWEGTYSYIHVHIQ